MGYRERSENKIITMSNEVGRPTEYNEQIADKLLDIVSTSNRSLASICKELNLHPSTIYRWLEKHKEFSDKYARAKEWQADFMAEEILEIADDSSDDITKEFIGGQLKDVENREFVSRSRLRVEARKWLASKLKPKKYAETLKTELSGKDGEKLVFEITMKKNQDAESTDQD